MTLNNIDIKNYNKNGVIVVKNVFKRKDKFTQKKINLYIKNYSSKLKGKELILSEKDKFNS